MNFLGELDRLRILLVEDLEDLREPTRLMLEECGGEVAEASDGLEALKAMAVADFDIVLCDLRMPRMDGYAFLAALRLQQGRPHPPVVAITAFANAADHRQTAAAGFEDHIDKPFNRAALLTTVVAVIARRRART